MTRRFAAAAIALAALTACDAHGGRSRAASVRFAFTAPGDARFIRLDLQPDGLVVDLPVVAGAATASTQLVLPVGTHSLTATALAGPDGGLVAIGAATTEVQVVAGSTASVSLVILDARVPPGPGDRAPIITSFSAPLELVSGTSQPVAVAATDLDGDPIAYAWSVAPSACGSFADPAAASTIFTGGSAGACVITAVAAARGRSDEASQAVTVRPVTAAVEVTGQFIPRPLVASVTLSGGGLAAEVVVTDRSAGTVTLPLAGGSDVLTTVAWTPVPVPVEVRLADTCGAATLGPISRSAGGALDTATFLWKLPSPPPGGTLACGVTVTVAVVGQPGLSDSFALGLEVTPPPCVAPFLLGVSLGPAAPGGSAGPPMLSWTDTPSETSYEVGRSFASGGLAPIAAVPQDTTVYLDSALVAPVAGAYCYGCAYAVRALAGTCVSAWSNVVIAPSAPPGSPPGPPGSPP